MPKPLPFGHVMGFAPGNIPAFSSDYDNILPADRARFRTRSSFMSVVAGHYCGFSFQCVEFARRWLILSRRITFPDVHMAYEIFDIPFFLRVASPAGEPASSEDGENEESGDEEGLGGWRRGEGAARVRVRRVPNGGAPELPPPGSLMIWCEGGFFRHTGHVAVVTEATEQFVRVAEQNVNDCSWEGRNYSRELRVECAADAKTGARGYTIVESLQARVMGWVVPEMEREELHTPLLLPDEIYEQHGIVAPACVVRDT